MNRLLFTPFNIGQLKLEHRVVMAPMTRMRTETGNVPGSLMVEHYSQRATHGGLIIAEATAVSPYAYAYADAPGIYNDHQEAGWKKLVDAVHAKGAFIFLQLWHPGRQSLPELSEGHQPVAPSALTARDTYGVGKNENGEYEGKLFPQPRELSIADIDGIRDEFRQAAERAKRAGFDGIEVHSANGYLPEQFLLDGSNTRTDQYGGSLGNRARFVLEVIADLTALWGKGRVGLRISPSGTYGDMQDSSPSETFEYLAKQLNRFDLAYLHIIEPRIVGPEDRHEGAAEAAVASGKLRPVFNGTIIAAGGFKPDTAETMLKSADADLITFGRLFTSNPDLPERIKKGLPLTHYNREAFFGGDSHGYNDFPRWENEQLNAE